MLDGALSYNKYRELSRPHAESGISFFFVCACFSRTSLRGERHASVSTPSDVAAQLSRRLERGSPYFVFACTHPDDAKHMGFICSGAYE